MWMFRCHLFFWTSSRTSQWLIPSWFGLIKPPCISLIWDKKVIYSRQILVTNTLKKLHNDQWSWVARLPAGGIHESFGQKHQPYMCFLAHNSTCPVFVFDFNLPNFSLGFQDVVTIDMLREAYPLLDVVDHNRRPKGSVSAVLPSKSVYAQSQIS